jgi:hypothetical protein
MWYTYLAIVCLVLVIFWNPVFEHMTNADIGKKTEFHASAPKKWEMPNPEDTKKKLAPMSTHKKADLNRQIMGPTIPEEDANAPAASKSDSKNGSGVYPSIYGPESIVPPGKNSKTSSTSQASEASGGLGTPEYTLTPTAEFPAGPAEPAPFLGDFSKFLR